MDTKGCNNRSIPRRIDVSLEGFLVVGEAPGRNDSISYWASVTEL